MNLDISLDGKRAVFAVLTGVILLILVFVTGVLSGIMMVNPGVGQRGTAPPRLPAVPPPVRVPLPSSPQPVQTPTVPVVSVPLPSPEPARPLSQIKGGGPPPQMVERIAAVPAPEGGGPVKAVGVTGVAPERRHVYSVQAGAFLSKENAERFVAHLGGKGYGSYMRQLLDSKKRTWYSVRIADSDVLEEARRIAAEFRSKENMPAVVTRIDSLTLANPESPPRDEPPPRSEKPLSPDKKEMQSSQKNEPPPGGKMVHLVRVRSFRVENNAVTLAESLKAKGYEASVLAFRNSRGKHSYTVILGEFDDEGKANQMALDLGSKEKISALVDTMRPYQLEKMKKDAQAIAASGVAEPEVTPGKREPAPGGERKTLEGRKE